MRKKSPIALAAALLGSIGGKAKSARKRLSSRENGRKGGRVKSEQPTHTMTSEDIQYMIDHVRVHAEARQAELLDICEALNKRIDTLKEELLQEKKWRAQILKSIPSSDWPL